MFFEGYKRGKILLNKVLEAKLVPAPNIIISLDTEFIENENENVIKNDCEINAAKRLLERLKKDYPKLPVCIQGDALYAAKTAGRGRWKIENEGFNNRKNGIYDIVHLNSRNSNAMKNHYLITQIADIIMQLYLAWSPLIKKVKQSKKIHLQGYWKVLEDSQ